MLSWFKFQHLFYLNNVLDLSLMDEKKIELGEFYPHNGHTWLKYIRLVGVYLNSDINSLD